MMMRRRVSRHRHYILNHRALTVLCLAADDNQVEEDYEDDAGGSDSAEEY
jgi:hypothetical protein